MNWLHGNQLYLRDLSCAPYNIFTALQLTKVNLSGQHSRVTGHCYPLTEVIDFATLPAQRLLAGNSYVKRHVTLE